ncbi:MAG: bifunctional 3-demethylubiquinol 3-O-methyltransferase/2-polyprenyl-6-hydroxyphenol methylase, partial [Alphaproteobacteria bacterium]|nr:bifunctional 3-demethylubiquinol 3-O-methyltransferase/2-polyprenyl-6-hydroxyphenol methylase [Alphaproteobacteria bacterium]
AVIGAEYILRWLPRGTHDWSKFLDPEDVRAPLRAAGMDIAETVGVVFQPVSGQWKIAPDTSVNYMVVARRPAA